MGAPTKYSVKTVPPAPPMKIWWTNASFFVGTHIAAGLAVYYYPPVVVARASIVLAFLCWHLAMSGITIGYHRLWSHRAFRASSSVRLVLAVLGTSGFQGSIKWWCLRHRLHHRYTDDPVHDPYAATRGLLWSHMGWIFFKPTYERMELVDREDLDNDPVVRFQHRYYVLLAMMTGFVIPTLIGALWGDAVGAFVYGGLVVRLAIWHCTFIVNSLAHWDGWQLFSDETSAKGNLLFALLTNGEGNHNFHHAFPQDFRAGPFSSDWDPGKWVILVLHRLGLATGLRRARGVDMESAKDYMHHKHVHGVPPEEAVDAWTGPTWTRTEIEEYIKAKRGRCVILVDRFVVDATEYLGDHPGGAMMLRDYSLRVDRESGDIKWRNASWAFDGGLNQHSRVAKRRLQDLRLAAFQS